MTELSASHMPCRVRQHVSNTGSKSTGELADDLEHLGGRGLLLQQISRSSLSRRTFWMAMTAWSANCSTSSICLSVNGRASRRRTRIAPIAVPS